MEDDRASAREQRANSARPLVYPIATAGDTDGRTAQAAGRLAEVDRQLSSTTSMSVARLQLLQERLDLESELARLDSRPPAGPS